jgi:hypothetical protein
MINTLMVPLVYDKSSEIGPIPQWDLFFACASATELNPPEGTEREQRNITHISYA